MKLIIKQSETQKRMVRASFVSFLIVFFMYASFYVYIVMSGLHLHKTLANVKQKNLELAQLEAKYAGVHDDLLLTKAEERGFVKINDSSFIVRKNQLTAFSMLYEGRQ